MPIGAGEFSFELGYEGEIYTPSLTNEIIGTQDGYVNGLADYLPFGRFVVQGAVAGTVELPTASGQKILGVAPVNNIFSRKSLNVTGYPPQLPLPILRKGIVLLKAETAMTRGGTVFVRIAPNGVNTKLGITRSTADGVTTVALSNVRVLDTVPANNIYRLEIDLPI